MSLVPVIAWVCAVALSAVVLSFCGYELWWKARRLQRDLARLETLAQRVARVQAEIVEVQRRGMRALRAATD